jgi:hypothetical protein
MEKVINQNLPFNEKQGLNKISVFKKNKKIVVELYSLSERPNWYQRVRLSIGIIEFFSDTWHHQDTDQHLYLCQPLMNSFGYDKDYESKVILTNHFPRKFNFLLFRF